MAVRPVVPVQSTAVAATDTTYGTVSLSRRMIDKCTAYNSDTTSRTLTINIVVAAGTAGSTNIVLVKVLNAGETYTCPEVVGHYLEPSDFLSAKASTAAVILLRVSMREVS